jgi:hypothetical protein
MAIIRRVMIRGKMREFWQDILGREEDSRRICHYQEVVGNAELFAEKAQTPCRNERVIWEVRVNRFTGESPPDRPAARTGPERTPRPVSNLGCFALAGMRR